MSTSPNDAVIDNWEAGRSNRSETPNARLRGRRLIITRIAWIAVVILIVALFLARLPAYYNALQTVCTGVICGYVQPTLDSAQVLQKLGLSVSTYATITLALEIALALLCFTLGSVIFWRRSDDWMALLGALAVVASAALNGYVFGMGMSSIWGWIAMCMYVFGGGMYVLVLSLADGRFVTRWVPWLLLCWGVAIIHYFFFHNYFYTLVWLAVLGILLVAQARYHRTAASPLQRQQSKWFILGGCVEVIIVVGTIIPPLIFPPLGQSGSFYRPVTALALVALSFIFPICIGVGILRYRLYDIDIIIGRALVYGTLTVCVIGVYVLVVGGLGMLIGTSGNLLISLLATGLIAVLFQPLRAALQRWVNRLLYGQRDEPYTVITRLSQRLKNTLAPEAILLTIVETVAQALKLPYVAIFLKQGNTFRLAASTGKLMGEPLVLPLIYQAETIGHLRLAPRTPGESFTPADQRLLDELSRQAGLAAHAVRLHEDLQRSYEQLEQRVAERTRELSSLLEISHTVASTLHLKPLLGLILDQLKLVIDYTGASILTVEGDYLVFLDHQGPIPQEQLALLRFSLAELGPIWHMFAAGSSILIDDVYEETELARTWRAATKDFLTTSFQPMHAWMALPLMRKDRLIGILVLTASEKQFFTQHHATLALAIANQAAIAIENARLYEQAQELAALEERQKLARELHDSVSQALYGIALGTHTARKLLERNPSLVAEQLEYILTLTKAGLAEMRALIFELRPESLETEGLVSALLKQVAALKARHDIAIETDLCDEPNLSLKTKQELYRVAQEALHNTMKHASASLVQVKLNWTDDAIILEIRDNGRGFNPQDSFPGHLGLLSMQERVKKLLGDLSIESTPDQGTTIRARIPAREGIHT